MATAPKNVYTHRLAIAEEYGFDAMQVTADGFTDEYLEVVGNHINGDTARRLVLESNAVLRTRIYWPDHAAQERARQAMEDDYRETIGDAGYQAVKELGAQHQRQSRQ